MIDIIDQFFADIAKTQPNLNKPHRLPDIWLNKSVITSRGKVMRIEPGDQIKLANGEIVDCNDLPTHEILECWGAVDHSFSLKLRNLETDNELTIKL